MKCIDWLKYQAYNCLYPEEGEVWLFHSVTDAEAKDDMLRMCQVSPSFLESKIIKAKRLGKTFVSIETLWKHLKNGEKLTNYIVVTLDDGYENNYSVAYPIFKKYKIPFCIYVATGFITGEQNVSILEPQKMMSKQQIAEISMDPLCTIGAHTCSHPHLKWMKPERQEKELKRSRELLQDWTKQSIDHVACPYGAYDRQTEEICAMLGFKTAVAAWGSAIRKHRAYDLYDIPRIIIKM